MSNYKRFVSYVYEYRDSKKQENRGFIKVEARNGQCQLVFSLKGLCRDGGGLCKLYAFRRNGDKLEKSLLGSQEVRDGILNCTLQMPQSQIGEKGYPLEELAGLFGISEEEQLYITQWDDESLMPDSLFSPEETPPADSSAPAAATPETEREPMTPETTDDSQPPLEEPPNITAETESDKDDVQATSTAPEATCNCFRDGSIGNCVKISPREIRRLHPQDWHLGNNRFVHYGYQTFGHLLVGQLADSGQYVLCVPGTYHQQECFMANMFGFPHFKQCPKKNETNHCFGYWYRSIQPTNLNSGDSPS